MKLGIAPSALLALLLATAGGRAAELQHLSVATMKNMPNAGLFVAYDRSYFRDEGLPVELIWTEAAQQGMMTVASGSADLGSGGMTAGFFNIAAKGGLKLIGASTREAPGFHNNGFVVSNTAYESGLRSLRDLPGHRVGINTFGATQHYAIALVAEKYGYKIDSVIMPTMQNFPNLVAAFRGGQLEAMVATGNIAAQMEAQKTGRVIGWSGDETPWQLGAIVVRPEMLTSRRAELAAYVRAYQRGAREFHAACNRLDDRRALIIDAACEEYLAFLSRFLDQPVGQLRNSIAFVAPDMAMDVGDVFHQLAFWQSRKLAPPDADAARMIDLSFAPASFNRPAALLGAK
jgi:NitT/TauT family transport system substrate-binding protein